MAGVNLQTSTVLQKYFLKRLRRLPWQFRRERVNEEWKVSSNLLCHHWRYHMAELVFIVNFRRVHGSCWEWETRFQKSPLRSATHWCEVLLISPLFYLFKVFFIRIIYKKHYQCKWNQNQRISSTEVLLEMKIYVFGAREGDTNGQQCV